MAPAAREQIIAVTEIRVNGGIAIATASIARDTAIHNAQAKKRNNALTTLLCGIVPAAALAFHASLSWERWLAGVMIGLIWGNGFEYAYHRLLLHRPRNPHGSAHQQHHATVGAPDQAEYVALITSPLNIVFLFVINGVPALLISILLGLRFVLSGIFLGWMLYVILCEEIHWRIHMDGWLPRGLQFARAYHMSHHDIPNRRYNVFFPLFDFLFGSAEPGKSNLLV